NENRAANSELRLNNKAHHKIQAAIPAETSQLLRLKPLLAILAKVVIGDRHRVKARTGHHRLPVGKLRWPFTTQPTAYQIRHLRHELTIIHPDPVPLQHGELRIVSPPPLAIPEYPGNLIDTTGTGCQQALHVILGGGLKPAAVHRTRADLGRYAVKVQIGDTVAAKHRRFHFQYLSRIKKAAHISKLLCTAFQNVPRGSRLPDRYLSHGVSAAFYAVNVLAGTSVHFQDLTDNDEQRHTHHRTGRQCGWLGATLSGIALHARVGIDHFKFNKVRRRYGKWCSVIQGDGIHVLLFKPLDGVADGFSVCSVLLERAVGQHEVPELTIGVQVLHVLIHHIGRLQAFT